MAKKSLQFRADGTFKIVQFTDLHWKNGEAEDEQTYALMKQILEQETPDLIVFTGDVIESEKTLTPREAFLDSVKIADQCGIPWAVVFGNHDAEEGITREELMELQQQSEFCVSESGPAEIKGVGNFVIEVQGAISQKVAAALYCFDSGSYSLEQVEGYEWIDMTQIGWYIEQSAEFTKNNNGRPIPALAFFHIPLPEYQELWNLYTCYGHNYEGVGSPLVNSGLYAAFIKMKDVKGTFAGHDHVNDFWGDLHGIRLCYGKATGFNGYGKVGLTRGARVIELKENVAGFNTWLRLEDGTKQDQQVEHSPTLYRVREHE